MVCSPHRGGAQFGCHFSSCLCNFLALFALFQFDDVLFQDCAVRAQSTDGGAPVPLIPESNTYTGPTRSPRATLPRPPLVPVPPEEVNGTTPLVPNDPEALFCMGASVRTRSHLAHFRKCSVIVGHLDLVGLVLNCCDFVDQDSVETSGCDNTTNCRDVKGALFPKLTDITGFLRLSDIHFPQGKDNLVQIFPVLTAVHGLMGINFVVDVKTQQIATTALLIELTNLRYPPFRTSQSICVKNPRSIGGRIGLGLLGSNADGDNPALNPTTPVALKNNPLLCNPEQGEEGQFPSFLNADTRNLGITGLDSCVEASSVFVSPPGPHSVQLVGELHLTSCPHLLQLGRQGSTFNYTALGSDLRLCEFDCERFSPPLSWADNFDIPCIRVCGGRTVVHVFQLATFFGCTRINGDVTIAIPRPPSYGDIEKLIDASLFPDLEQTSTLLEIMEIMFGDVIWIDGALRILGTDCMTHLGFLKSLGLVTGPVAIIDNKFLSDIGVLKYGHIQFGSTVTFRRNSNLCPQDIAEMRRASGLGSRVIEEQNGLSGYCCDCISDFQFDINNVPLVGNVLGLSLNLSHSDVSEACDAAISEVYPDLIDLNVSLLAPTIHIWTRPVLNYTMCDSQDEVLQSELESYFDVSNNCTDRLEEWSSFPAGDAMGESLRNPLYFLQICACYAMQLRMTWITGDGNVYRIAKSNLHVQQTPAFGRLPPMREVAVHRHYATALDLALTVPRFACSHVERRRMFNFTLEVRYTPMALSRRRLYTGSDTCRSNVPSYVNFTWTSSESSEADRCTIWPTAPANNLRAPPATRSTTLTQTGMVMDISRTFTLTIPGLVPSTQYFVETRYSILDNFFSEWTVADTRVTWTSDSPTIIDIHMDPPQLHLPQVTRRGPPPLMGLKWMAANDASVHMYRLVVQPACSTLVSLGASVSGDALNLGQSTNSDDYYGTALADEMRSAGCVSCDNGPQGSTFSTFTCYHACRAGSECLLENVPSLACLCANFRCSVSVAACALNGTCSYQSASVDLFNYTSACYNRSLAAAAPACPLTNRFVNTACLYVDEQCFGQASRARNGTGSPSKGSGGGSSGSGGRGRGISDLTVIQIIVPLALLGAAAIGVLLVCSRHHRKRFQDRIHRLEIEFGADHEVVDYEADDWEVEAKNVEVYEELGQGAFGQVFKGVLYTTDKNGEDAVIEVAIKTAKCEENATVKSIFLREASVMKKFSSPYIVQLIGIVSQVYEESPMVLMEYMPNRDLRHYLISTRPPKHGSERVSVTQRTSEASSVQLDSATSCASSTPPALNPLPEAELFIRWATHLARGLDHLVEKRFVHRDLSARNCMLDGNLNLKISDFGFTRDIYQSDYYRKTSDDRGALPIRWLPHEALDDGLYSSATDVWSYGVVLWEMAALGRMPYRGMSNNDVIVHIMEGGHLKLQQLHAPFPDLLKGIMLQCFTYVADVRPTAKQIVSYLELPEVPDWMTFDELLEPDRRLTVLSADEISPQGSACGNSVGSSLVGSLPHQRTNGGLLSAGSTLTRTTVVSRDDVQVNKEAVQAATAELESSNRRQCIPNVCCACGRCLIRPVEAFNGDIDLDLGVQEVPDDDGDDMAVATATWPRVAPSIGTAHSSASRQDSNQGTPASWPTSSNSGSELVCDDSTVSPHDQPLSAEDDLSVASPSDSGGGSDEQLSLDSSELDDMHTLPLTFSRSPIYPRSPIHPSSRPGKQCSSDSGTATM